MPIEFLCDHCGTKLRTPDGSSGKKTNCPQCEAILTIPEPSVATPPPVPSAPVPAQQSNADGFGEWEGFENPGRTDFSSLTEFNETGNPWQAPADYGPEPPAFRAALTGTVTGNQLGFTQAFSMTYETLKSNFLPFFVLGIIAIGYGIIIYVISIILNFAVSNDPNLAPLFLLSNFIINTFSFLLGLGISFCAVDLIRTGTTSFATGFSILTKILSLFVFWVIMGLLTLVVIVVPLGIIAFIGWSIESSGGNGLGWIVGLGLGIPWYIISLTIILCRFGFGPLLIVDQKASALQAFSLSWNMTKRNSLMLFCIFLVFGLGAAIGACCTIGLGYFIVIPFGICLTAMCYHIMWEQYSAKTAQQEVTEW